MSIEPGVALLLPLIGVAASVAVALLLAIAGIDKLRHRDLLPGVIANYRLLPAALVAPVALLLPVAELLVAAGLLAGAVPLAPAAAMALLLLFAAAMAINIGRGRRHIDCGCGHAGLKEQLGWSKVWRNLVLAAALVPALVASRAELGMADLAVAVAAGVMAWLMLLMVSAVAALGAVPAGKGR